MPLKYRAREQRLAQGAGRFRQDRAARKLRARLFDQLKIRIRALAQRRDAEQLALSAVDGRIAILAAKPGNLRVHRVIIALGGIEAAGRDHDLPLAGAVVPARVAAGVRVGHKRQRHRQLPVDEQLQLAWNAEIIERKAPDQHVGGKNFPDHTGHIVLQYALARRFAPAGEAAAARQQMQLSDPYVKKLLGELDLLVDGRFLMEEKNIELRFRGSANQRVLDVPKSLEAGAAVWAEQYR